MVVAGSIDVIDEHTIFGWAWNPERPTEKVTFEIVYKGSVMARLTADAFRSDLKDAGIAGGFASFACAIPHVIPKCDLPYLSIRSSQSGEILPLPAVISERGTVTEFPAGLWIDRADFEDQLARRQADGKIAADIASALRDFTRDGYVIFKKAVPDDAIEAVNADIDRIWANPPEGMMIETLDLTGTKMDILPVSSVYRDKCTKLLDLHAYMHSARTVITPPKVVEFLETVFEAKSKAFQTLTFWNGSRQSIHKDSAYVRIDSDPARLMATWLALEDISPGSGELEYYVGSHRGPEFLFGGVSKWMNDQLDEHTCFLKTLQDDAARLQYPKRSFLAKRGDVLIWHAELAHGGSPITNPSRSRRSLVTHFTSARDEPYYRRRMKFQALEIDKCVFISQHKGM